MQRLNKGKITKSLTIGPPFYLFHNYNFTELRDRFAPKWKFLRAVPKITFQATKYQENLRDGRRGLKTLI